MCLNVSPGVRDPVPTSIVAICQDMSPRASSEDVPARTDSLASREKSSSSIFPKSTGDKCDAEAVIPSTPYDVPNIRTLTSPSSEMYGYSKLPALTC